MPGMVYLSQPTEYGTLYSRKELAAISALCREKRQRSISTARALPTRSPVLKTT